MLADVLVYELAKRRHVTTSTLLDLAVNDYVELIFLQNSGSALNVTTSDGGPGLMMGRVA